ncbi:hypothetical protein BpHYR1_037030 [Brachionus plicatilis]|uniref:Uncharacterized protein n=1 Tax=Brachionus plicatilis TaxID=10195 RepID=A0A3M7SM61_BRAPC|nr:hypothetical protein BpHYR1_037030 [Brachionus plicatilis]
MSLARYSASEGSRRDAKVYFVRYEAAGIASQEFADALVFEKVEKVVHFFVGDNEFGFFGRRLAASDGHWQRVVLGLNRVHIVIGALDSAAQISVRLLAVVVAIDLLLQLLLSGFGA